MRILLTVWLLLGTIAMAQTDRPRAARQGSPVPTTGAPVVSETLAVQIMLDRAGFSPGEIDGKPGANLKRATTAFQRAHGLPTSGQVDQITWQRLSEGGQTPLTTYALTDADVAGPFVSDIPTDLMAQSKLMALGYRNALEALGEKFHVSPALLQQLNRGAAFRTAGEQIVVPNVEPFDREALGAKPEASSRGRGQARGRGAAAEGRGRGQAEVSEGRGRGQAEAASAVTIAVTKSTSSLTVEDASGRVLFHAPVTSGSEHDPLPIGTWKVTTVQRMPVFNYNPDLFWDANPAHSKAKIPAGPNNPVGVAWIDLSKEHYGIHGAPEPSRIGHAQSHGCVRLTNWDAARVLQWAQAGTAVVFRE
jgi:lipoprotein-anchoring transpeptidase ErfK/SrfK